MLSCTLYVALQSLSFISISLLFIRTGKVLRITTKLQEILFSLKTEILLRFRSNYLFLLTRMISRLNVDVRRLLKILQSFLVYWSQINRNIYILQRLINRNRIDKIKRNLQRHLWLVVSPSFRQKSLLEIASSLSLSFSLSGSIFSFSSNWAYTSTNCYTHVHIISHNPSNHWTRSAGIWRTNWVCMVQNRRTSVPLRIRPHWIHSIVR